MNRCAFVTAVLVAAVFAGSVSAASTARIEGTVRGLPSPDQRAYAAVQAVQATNGRIVAVQELGSGSRYRLRVKPGIYLLEASATGADGRSLTKISHALIARAGRTVRSSLGAPPAAGGPVVAIGDIELSPAPGTSGPPVPVQDAVITRVLPALQAQGIRLVSRERRFVAAARREAELSDQGRTAHRFEFRPLKAQFTIAGDGEYDANGNITFELRVRDRNGFLLATKTVTSSGADWDGFVGQLRDVSDQLAAEAVPKIEEAAAQNPEPPGREEVNVKVSVRAICTCGFAIWGKVTASVVGLVSGYDNDYVEQELSLPVGTTVLLTATPEPGRYFGGWKTSTCGWSILEQVETDASSFACTVTLKPPDAGPYDRFQITAWADFFTCPEVGVARRPPGAAECPDAIGRRQ